jgi:hypothetical protein
MPTEPPDAADDGPLLTPTQGFGLTIVILGLLLLFAGTLGLSGVFQAMIALGLALIALGSGFLGFQARSNTGTRT